MGIIFLALKSSYTQELETIHLKKSFNQDLPYFYHLLNDRSVEENSIVHIAQDSIGQMWFATKDGVVRYDSKTFYTYRKDPENEFSIGGNFVERIFVDRDGGVWVGTEPAVLSKYNPISDDFNRIKGISGGRIKDIKQDKDGLLWITSNSTLYSYNELTKQLNKYELDDSTIGIDRLLITSNNSFWITTNQNYILKFSSGSFKKLHLVPEKEQRPQASTQIYSNYYIEEDHKGYLWITTPYRYLLKYDPKTEQLSKFVFEETINDNIRLDNGNITVMFLFEDNSNNLWWGTWFNGLYKVSEDRKTLSHYLPQRHDPNSLSNTIIHSGFQDNMGYLWFGTEFAGLNILKKKNKFSIISHGSVDSNASNSLPMLLYETIAVDDSNRVWVATVGGGLYYFKKEYPQELYLIDLTAKVKSWEWVYTMLYDSKGFLWLGTNNGLIKYHLESKETIQYLHDKENYQSILSNAILSIIEDKNGIIWIGTPKGLSKLMKDSKSFYHFTHDDDDPKSLSNNRVTCLYADKDQNIWVGTLSGLNKLNSISGNFTTFTHSYDNKNNISANRINSIHEKNNCLWIGTQGGGLNRYDFETKSFMFFDVTDGLPSETIKAVTDNENTNDLWFTTPYHLVKFNTENFQFISYDRTDGIEKSAYIENLGQRDFEFVNDFAVKDKEGNLYFGGLTGMCIFHPDSLTVNSYKSPIIITEILVNGSAQEISESLTLNSNQNDLEITTILLNYIQSEKNSYAFYLENYDSSWQYTGNKNRIKYYDLLSGTYKLHFKGANNDAIWHQNTNPVTVIIRPQFYNTNFFYFLVLGFFMLLILVFFSYKIYLLRKLRRQKEIMRYNSSNLSKQKVLEINSLLLKKMESKDLYLDADLSLQKLAHSIKENSNSLSQVINQIHHKNFNEFVNNYRLEEAKLLLRTTSLKIEAVAFDSGFNSLSTFNAFFKKEIGQTPSAYRKQNKE